MKTILKVMYCCLITATLTVKAQDINGTWESLGYGRLLKIEKDIYQISEITSLSCTPSMKGNLSELNNKIETNNDTLILTNGINRYYFLKNNTSSCNPSATKKKAKDPIYNFEVLAENFNNHYSFFKERNIDWPTLYQKYCSQVSAKTTELELYFIIKNMLDEFGDGHIKFSATDKIKAKVKAMNPATVEEKQTKIPAWKLAQEVAETMLDSIKSKRGGSIRWGILDGNIGYLQLNQMLGFGNFGIDDNSSVPDFWKAYVPLMYSANVLQLTYDEKDGITTIMDEVMVDLKETQGIIIDVRFNGGGKDEVGLEVLSRFNPERKKIGVKKAIHNNGFSPEIGIYVEGNKNAYTNSICILTSKATASAAEIFVMASLSIENTTRIGGITEGITSDMLDKTLPNGWEFSLSNEIYVDNKGINYEHIGVTPDVIMYNTNTKQGHFQEIKNTLENKKDPTIEKAIEIITSK